MSVFEIEKNDVFSVAYTDLHELLEAPCKIEQGLILLCISGTAEVSIQLNVFEIQERTIMILFPHTILTLNRLSSDFKLIYISFSKTLLDEAVFRLGPAFFRFIRDRPCYLQSPEGYEIMKSRIRLVQLTFEDRGNIYRDIIVKNQLQNFFLNVYDKTHHVFGWDQNEEKDRSEELFHKFIDLIHSHFQTQKNVAYYARQLYISPRYLSTICRHVTHESAKTVIDRHIILEIKVMLHSSKMSVQEISLKLNFPNQSYLGRFFKKHTGQSPSEYRDRMRR